MRSVSFRYVVLFCFAGCAGRLAHGGGGEASGLKPIPLARVEPAPDGAYRVDSPRGGIHVTLEWRDQAWWLRMTRDKAELIPFTAVSPHDFSLGQHMETGDLNGDDQPDLIFVDYGGGVGVMAWYRHLVVMLSHGGGYRLQIITDYGYLEHAFHRYRGGTILMIRQLVYRGDQQYWLELPLTLQDGKFLPDAGEIPGGHLAYPVWPEMTAEHPDFDPMYQEAVRNLEPAPERTRSTPNQERK